MVRARPASSYVTGFAECDFDARKRRPERTAPIGLIDTIEQTDGSSLGETVSLTKLHPGGVEPGVLHSRIERRAAADAEAQRSGAP